jgi:uncharacterized membrane protein
VNSPQTLKQRAAITWNIVLFPVLFPVVLAVTALLFAICAVVRVRDFRHLPRGVYPVGLDGDFEVWSRRRASRYAMFAHAVDLHDFRRMTPAQQARWKHDRGWLIDGPIPAA